VDPYFRENGSSEASGTNSSYNQYSRNQYPVLEACGTTRPLVVYKPDPAGGHIYYCKRLLGFTNLSKILSNSMNSGLFAPTHTSKVAHSPCAPAPLSMVQ
jgi:hypothetical protein